MKTVGMLHQYSLFASGSCLYARRVAQSLLGLGWKVHLISRELNPERYDFIDEAYLYADEEDPLFKRSDNPQCVSHTVLNEIIPVSAERAEFPDGKLFTALSDDEIERYVRHEVKTIGYILKRHKVDVMMVNHVLLYPYIARLLKEETGIPYVVVVHGSTIEFVLKKDARYRKYALEGLEGASKIVALNSDVWERVTEISPDFEEKLVEIPVGVNVELFHPTTPQDMKSNLYEMERELIRIGHKGKNPYLKRRTGMILRERSPRQMASSLIDVRKSYSHGLADDGITDTLSSLDWEGEATIVYVGRLLLEKGVHCLLTAMPGILNRCPNTRLLVVGDGIDRELFELIVEALDSGELALMNRVMDAAKCYRNVFEGNVDDSLGYLEHFLNKDKSSVKAYLKSGKGKVKNSVIFTGYLSQHAMVNILGVARISIVPSIVKEAFPLVSLEALASGVIPVGSYEAGLRPILSEIGSSIPRLGESVRLRREPGVFVDDIVDKVTAVLGTLEDPTEREEIRGQCRQLVSERYSWDKVAKRLTNLFDGLV